MTVAKKLPLSVKIIRWIARIWAFVVTIFTLLIIILPDENATGPIAAVDWFLLSFYVAAVLSLMVAWKWEFAGAILSIATMVVRELAWVILKGDWLVQFLLFWMVVLPPAILFLVAHGLEKDFMARTPTI